MKKSKKQKKLFPRLLLIFVLLAVSVVSLFPMMKNLKFGLDLQGGFEVLYQVKSIDSSPVTKDMVTSTYKTIDKRINVLGVSEPEITIEGDDKIRVQLAGITDPKEARNLISQAANLTFRDTKDNLLMNSDVLKSGGAKVGQDGNGRPAVALSVKDNDKFYEMTKRVSEMDDNRIVIWLDYEETDSFSKEKDRCGTSGSSKCLSVASVTEGFASDVIIQGNFSQEEVKSLVDLINSGSLPTKLEEISSKTVEASFGADSLQKTAIAGVIGVSLIVLFMIVTYRFAGFVASVGIMIYSLLTFLTFWLFGGVLTLPGIAAVVIGIGMAVDSCVINFSRIKDNLYEGTHLEQAVKKGNKDSFMTIFDSNFTTFIVAFILFLFGESSIKGFATMLMISIVVTIIIMVLLTRALLTYLVKTGFFDDKQTLFIGINKKNIPSKAGKRTKYPFQKMEFVGNRKWFYLGSIVAIVAGIVSLSVFGLKLGIDFKGGSTITLKGEQALSVETLKKDLKELNYVYYSDEQTDEQTITLRVTDSLSKEDVLKTETYFKEKYNVKTDIGVVSNIVKQELIKNAFLSLLIASVGIVIYVSLRFKISYAVSGVVALFHDAFLIVAVFSLLHLEVTSIFIAAVLSIIGYSINDTIVAFDRIRQNLKDKYNNQVTSEEQLKDVVNTSLRETFTRSLITTITTLIPVVCLILFGSYEIINFNIALLIGLISGAYSSIFIASQLWFDIERRKLGKPQKKKMEEDEEVEEIRIKGINA